MENYIKQETHESTIQGKALNNLEETEFGNNESDDEIKSNDLEHEEEADDIDDDSGSDVGDDSDDDDDDNGSGVGEEDKEEVKKEKIKEDEDVSIVEKNVNEILNINNTLEEDLDDDSEDEDYLKKLNGSVRNNLIEKHHPEVRAHNYEEISTLTYIVRDRDNNIKDPLHTTMPFLSKYERTRVLGQRAKQINSGARPFIDNVRNIIDGYIIAEMELNAKLIPFIIRRPLPNGGSEYWKLADLQIL